MDNFKIGARQLSGNEAKLILPTFDQIFIQISDMRTDLNAKSKEIQEDENTIQKTNNIGILGCRGAGKTSVLKTISRKLENEKNKNNIILPIIVPENMSNSSTLMATILGLFKKEVEETIEKYKKANTNSYCISEGDVSLKRKYNEVIKQYTFIQKEYRDVLINEFTTENEYVKKSNEIFNSDIEFITKFNEFIKELASSRGENTLIFFFIDDIDLSASRCTDVIKTLLSYISHKNIVTFISGDLDTFEEALTIDFLRQENALVNGVWDVAFLNNGQTLIERKKLLAYEYLKKVVPPVFRHNIKRWSLEDRGNYIIENHEKNKDENLSDLLTKTLSDYVKPSFFKFINYKSDSKGEEEILPYAYHLFDDTSRGLNNIYSVLALISKRKIDGKKILFSDRKILIETIAASKPVFNKFREQLFGDIVNFGSTEESTVIRFDNLMAMFSINKKNINDKSNNEDRDKEKEISIIEQFQLFIFVDFVAKLVKYEDKTSKKIVLSYTKLKIYITNILLNNPSISGSSFILRNPNNYKEYDIDREESTPVSLLSNFLLKAEWELALTFYRNLSFDTYEILPTKVNDLIIKEKSNILQDYVWSLYLSLKSVSQLQHIEMLDYISDIYDSFAGEFAYIQDSLSINEIRNTVEFIFGDIIIPKILLINSKNDSKRLVNNFIYEITKDRIFESDKKIKSLNYDEYKNTLEGNELSRLKLIHNIDKNNLWDHSMAVKVKTYIKVRINTLISELFKKDNTLINMDIFINDSLREFKEINKGVSNTKAKILQNLLNNINYYENKVDFGKWSDIKSDVAILAYNNRVSYGQYEAQNMLNVLNSLYPDFKECNEDINELVRVLHYFAIYSIKEMNMESVYLQSEQLSKFNKDISSSQGQVNNKMITDFIKSINEDIDKKIGVEQFEKLFY